MTKDPRSDDLGSAWTTSKPPSKNSRARNNRLDDLTTTWTKESTNTVGLNPRGRMPDDPKAVPYPEQDQHLWELEALYGKQTPLDRRGRKP